MNKKKLNIEELNITSFVTAITENKAQTVKGKGPESDVIHLCPENQLTTSLQFQ